MAAKIKLLRSVTPGAVPVALDSGQLAINEHDGKLFWRNHLGVVQAVDLFGAEEVPTQIAAALVGYATQTFVGSQVSSAVAAIVASAPTSLNTLAKLASALGSDASFATTVATALGNKADLAALGGKVSNTGNETINGVKTFGAFPILPSAAPTDNFQAATKKYVDDAAGVFAGYAKYSASQTVTILGTKAYVRMAGSFGGGGVIADSENGNRPAFPQCGAALTKFLTGLTLGGTLALTIGATGTSAANMNNLSQNAPGGNGGVTTLASGTQAISALTCPGGLGGAVDANANATPLATGGDNNFSANGAQVAGRSTIAGSGTGLTSTQMLAITNGFGEPYQMSCTSNLFSGALTWSFPSAAYCEVWWFK
jgi:hypothetical protein